MKWPWTQLQNLWRAQRWPTHCAICNSWGPDVLCETCVSTFAQPRLRCKHCALPVLTGQRICTDCQTDTPALDYCIASVSYDWPWPKVMVDFKFSAQPAWAKSLALLMRHTPGAELLLESCDVVVPIPVSGERLAERGFNQSVLLARHLAKDKMHTQWLQRLRHTEAQSHLPRQERLHNLDQAFALEPMARPSILGKRIVLIDDVMTTGTTLRQAAGLLRQAGAGSVSALVFARA
jgi:ComF family protein